MPRKTPPTTTVQRLTTEVISEGLQNLPVYITPEERIMHAQAAHKAMQDRESAEVRLEAMKKEIQGEIGKFKLLADASTRIAGSGVEYRDVPVKNVANYGTGEMLTIRDDTGEVVDRRPLTPREKQKAFDFDTPSEQTEARFGRLDYDTGDEADDSADDSEGEAA